MMDEPGRVGSLEKWELHLERVNRPKDALEREPRIRRAQEVIADIRKHRAKTLG